MIRFDAWNLSTPIRNLQKLYDTYEGLSVDEPGTTPDKADAEELPKAVKMAGSFCERMGFSRAQEKIEESAKYLSNYEPDVSAIANELRNVIEAIQAEALKVTLLRVPEQLAGYVDRKDLFGREVYNAFPSAREDIRDAGNCLALGCNTAAVFHLMRVA